MRFFVVTDSGDNILRCYTTSGESLSETADSGETITEVPTFPGFGAPTPTSKLRLVSGLAVWQELATLSQVKERQWEYVKTARKAYIETDMTTPYGTFQTKSEDRDNITAGVVLAKTLVERDLPASITWTLADNTSVTLNSEQMVNVGLFLAERTQNAHGHARTLRAAIDAATNVSEVLDVEWTLT